MRRLENRLSGLGPVGQKRGQSLVGQGMGEKLAQDVGGHGADVRTHLGRGDHMLRGLGEGNAWPISLRQAAEKLEQQAKKLKSKWTARKRKGAGSRIVRTAPAEAPVPPRRVVRATRYAVKPMSIEDAALRVEGTAENFVVFRNADTEAVSILYRRRDGNLGLIEPE